MLLNLCKHVLCHAAKFVSNVASMPLPLSSLSRSISSGKHPSLRNSLRLVAKDLYPHPTVCLLLLSGHCRASPVSFWHNIYMRYSSQSVDTISLGCFDMLAIAGSISEKRLAMATGKVLCGCTLLRYTCKIQYIVGAVAYSDPPPHNHIS